MRRRFREGAGMEELAGYSRAVHHHGALRAHQEFLGDVAPVNATVIVVDFPAPGMLVEVELDPETSE
jgi:hypothetical protein